MVKYDTTVRMRKALANTACVTDQQLQVSGEFFAVFNATRELLCKQHVCN